MNQKMPIGDALALRSLEGYLHCRACLNSGFAKKCPVSGDRHVFPGDAPVSELTGIMRRHHWYFSLLHKLRTEGQQEPIEVCAQGTCIREGHHRIAIAQQLGWTHVLSKTSRERCDHQPFIPDQVQSLLREYARS